MNAAAPNVVDVDRDAIVGEFLKKGEGPEPQGESSVGGDANGSTEQPAGEAMDWATPVAMLVGVFAQYVAPNWGLSEEEQGAIIQTSSKALELCFPTVNVEGKWSALGVCAITLGGVIMTRYDRESGKLKPMRVAPPAPAADEQNASP